MLQGLGFPLKLLFLEAIPPSHSQTRESEPSLCLGVHYFNPLFELETVPNLTRVISCSWSSPAGFTCQKSSFPPLEINTNETILPPDVKPDLLPPRPHREERAHLPGSVLGTMRGTVNATKGGLRGGKETARNI